MLSESASRSTMADSQRATEDDATMLEGKETTQGPTDKVEDELEQNILAYITELRNTVINWIDLRQEPVDQLKELNVVLNNNYLKLQSEFAQPDGEQKKKDFYKTILKDVSAKILAEKVVNSPSYMPQIFRFFRNVLVNFFPADIGDESLAEIVHSIFNFDSALYQTALSSIRMKKDVGSLDARLYDEEDLQYDSKRVEAEREWRNSLKEGDRLECLGLKNVSNNRLWAWMRGTIRSVEGDELNIFFDNDQGLNGKIAQRFNLDIAPLDTFTDDSEWRYSLAEGQLIDCMDAQGVWYRSTVLETKNRQQGGVNIKEVNVGYRYYDEEEGHKTDERDGKKYVGWSHSYDEWKSVTCPTIQKHRSMSKHYTIAGKNTMMYDIHVSDMQDHLYNSSETKIFAISRQEFLQNLKCIPVYLNEFGFRKGYENVIEFFKDVQHGKKVTLKHIFYIVDFLGKTNPLLHKQFAVQFIPRFKSHFEKALLAPPYYPLQSQFTQEMMNQITKQVQNILRRHYTPEFYNNFTAQIQFSVGFALLKSEKLDLRIKGLKEINEQVRTIKNSMKKTMNVKDCIKMLKDQQIFNKIFGDNYHIQLIQRSQEIMRLFVNERELGEVEIDAIWAATKKDQQSKMEIYKIISELSHNFKNEDIEILVRKFSTIPPDDFVQKEIECVYELTKYIYKMQTCSKIAVDLFWDIAAQERPYKKQIVETAIDKLLELIKNWDREQKFDYIQKCINKLQTNDNSSLSAIKILQKILDSIPSYRVNNQPTLIETATQLLKQFDLLNLVIFDLGHYEEAVNELYAKGIMTDANMDSFEPFNLPFSHRVHVFTRLNFIRQILANSSTKFEQVGLDLLWDIVMVNSKIPLDADIFFNWLKTVIGDQNKLTPELTHHFFINKVCAPDASFKTIRKAGFDCIQSMFLKINEAQNKMMIISMPSNLNSVTKLEFKVHVPPDNLEGIECLWKLLQQGDKKNLDLITPVIDLINKCYSSLSTLIEGQVHEIQANFCSQSLSRLQSVINEPSLSLEEKKQFSFIICVMIKSFFDDSEIYGAPDLKPHNGIDRGTMISRLVIENKLTQMKDTPKLIEVNVYSNMTVWDLKRIIGKKTKHNPLRVSLSRHESKKIQILDTNNTKLLRDFFFEEFELVSATKKSLSFQPRLPILDQNKELVPQAVEVFTSWFERYSCDGFMTPETCVEFIKGSTNDHTVVKTDKRVVAMFNEYDRDFDGRITLDDFLYFYTEKANLKIDLVWDNLGKHGIGNNLKPISNQYSEEDPNEKKDSSILPRYKITTNQESFSLLMNLLDQLGPDGQDNIWNLINNSRTNPQTYAKLLTLADIDSIMRKDISVYELLYSLKIWDSFIQNFKDVKEQRILCYYNESQGPSKDQEVSLNKEQDDKNRTPTKNNTAKIHPSDVPISLPAAPISGANIPLPPSGAFIGPIPPLAMANVGQDKSKLKDQIDNFKGQIIEEIIPYSYFSDEEILSVLDNQISQEELIQIKDNWLHHFVHKGGVKILLYLFEMLITQQQGRKDFEVLKNKVESESISQVLKLVKNILTACFMSHSGTTELSLELERKLSQIQEVEESPEKKDENKVQEGPLPEKQSNFAKNQAESVESLQSLMKVFEGQLAGIILSGMDFRKFQEQVLNLIQIVLRKHKGMGGDERNIVEQAMQLWISCLTYDADLLQKVIDEENAVEDIETGIRKTKLTSDLIIDEGLLNDNFTVRECFKDSLKFICSNIKSQSLSIKPSSYFLKRMLQKLHNLSSKNKESKQFFTLLKSLFHDYIEEEKSQQIGFVKLFDNKEFFDRMIGTLLEYNSQEKKNSMMEDHNLIGFIDIIREMISHDQSLLTKEEAFRFVEQLITKCLFTYRVNQYEGPITKDVDILAYEKPNINKCMTTESRTACYGLVMAIVAIYQEFVGQILKDYWCPLLEMVQKPKKSGFNPRTEQRSYHGYSGIKNLGSICYMNAMLQQFFHCPTFRYGLLSVDDQVAPNMQDFQGTQVDDNMLHQLQRFFSFLELTERQDFTPTNFCFAFKDFGGQPTNVRLQQDTQEFLGLVFDRLEKALDHSTQKYLTHNVFGGVTCTLMICKGCGSMKQRKEPFYTLQLEVNNQKSIHEGLKKLIQGETINDYNCEDCSNRCDVEKKTVIDRLPNTLLVHLQRLVFDYDQFCNKKLNSRVEFPNVLNMKQFMLGEVLKQEKELTAKMNKDRKKQERLKKKEATSQVETPAQVEQEEDSKKEDDDEMIPSQTPEKATLNGKTDQESEEEEDEADQVMADELPDEDFEYKLVGVVIHMGTADAGHYLSYINIERDKHPSTSPEWLQTEKQKWIEFNDSQVKNYVFNNLEEDCFGGLGSSISTTNDFKGDYSKNAYILIYDKRKKEGQKIVLPSELLPSLDCDGTAISSEVSAIATQTQNLLAVLPQLKSVTPTLVQISEQEKEYQAIVDFNSTQKFVPNSNYKVVSQDNLTFLCEKQIFTNQFFQCTLDLLSIIVAKNPEYLEVGHPFCDQLFTFTERLVFDLLPLAQENKCLQGMTLVYTQMLDKNLAKTFEIIDQRVLLPKEKVEKEQRGFLESLVASMDREVREMNAVVLIYIINKLFQIKNYDLLEEIMKKLFDMIPDELSKNWLKIQQFLFVFLQVSQSGVEQMNYLIEKKLISKLIDFFLENDSPMIVNKAQKRSAMGSNYANPPFENLLLTISYIARHQKWIPDPLEQNENENMGGDQFVSPLYLGHQPAFYYQVDFPPLSQDCISMLFSKQFILKALKWNQETIEFSRLFAHLSFENHNYSRKVCQKVLVGLNKANADETYPFLKVTEQILIIQDSHFQKRIEWLIGVAHIKIDKPAVYQVAQGSSNTKFGVQILDLPSDDVFEYQSTAHKLLTSSKDPMIQLIYQFRKRWTSYSLKLLYSLLYSCIQDHSNRLFTYLKSKEPPAYIYGRYMDSIKPFLMDQIKMCERNLQIQSYKNELEICFDCIRVLRDLESKEENLQFKIQGNFIEKNEDRTVLQYSSTDGGPDNYLIWQPLSEKTLVVREFPDDKITVMAKEFTCRISESKPDGFNNKVFPEDLFRSQYGVRYDQSQNVGSSAASGVGRGRGRGRGQQQYGRGQDNNWTKPADIGAAGGAQIPVGKVPFKGPQKTKNIGRYKQKNFKIKVTNSHLQIGAAAGSHMNNNLSRHTDAEVFNTQDEYDYYDDETADKKNDSMEVEDDNEREVESDNEPYPKQFQSANQQDGEMVDQDPQDSGIPQVGYDGETFGVYADEVAAMQVLGDEVAAFDNHGGNSQGRAAAGDPLSFDVNQHVPISAAADQQPVQHQEAAVQQDFVQKQEDSWEMTNAAVMVFYFINDNHARKQKVSLKFTDLSQNGEKLNFKIPASEISRVANAGREQDIISFTKLRPFDDWGTFDFSIEINKDKNVGVPQLQPVSQDAVDGRHSPLEDVEMIPQDDFKECGACTFHNPTYLTNCEVCGNNLG